MKDISVLVVDDEAPIRDFLSRWLEQGRAHCRVAEDGASALKAAAEHAPDVVFLDIRLPDMSGLDILPQLRAAKKPPEVVLMSAYADVSMAVRGFRDGACDLIQKPFGIARLMEGLEVALARRAAAANARPLPPGAGEARPAPVLIARSPAMRELATLIERVAPADATVLIEGETGTGKEIVARRIHGLGKRSAGPFIAVNCGAIPESLIEAELFGHEAGAFTGATGSRTGRIAAAAGGVLFLDEVGELTPAAQSKLLRVIQERTVVPVGATRESAVDIRVLAATNRDLGAHVRAGKFRQDLLFRLDVVRLVIPPLRQRPEDVEPLVEHLLGRLGARYGRAIEGADRDALDALRSYRYPGNVRELENILERAIALGATGRLTLADLPPHLVGPQADDDAALAPAPMPGEAGPRAGGSFTTLEEAERSLFRSALATAGGNCQRAARLLGVSSKTVSRKIKRYNL